MKKTRLIAMLLAVVTLFGVIAPVGATDPAEYKAGLNLESVIFASASAPETDGIKDPIYIGETEEEDPLEVDYGITSRSACDKIYYMDHTEWDEDHTDVKYVLESTCTTPGYEIRRCDCGVRIYAHYGFGMEDEAYAEAENYIKSAESDSTKIIMTYDAAYDSSGHDFQYLAEAWIEGQQWLV